MDHTIHHLCHAETMSKIVERVISIVLLHAKLKSKSRDTINHQLFARSNMFALVSAVKGSVCDFEILFYDIVQ